MTRTKEILKEAEKAASANTQIIGDWGEHYLGFIHGAEWADAHPDIDVRTMAAWQSGYNEGIAKYRWISVEDELPKEGQSCIILIDRKALQGMPRIRSAVYAPNVMMQQEGFAYNRMSKKHHITHWMPLPQAPTVAENAAVKEKGGEHDAEE